MGLFCAGTLVVLAADAGDLRSSTPRFYDDDPLLQDVDSRDASGVQERTINLIHDYARNLFATPGSREDRRALNINTIAFCGTTAYRSPAQTWPRDRATVEGRRPAPGPSCPASAKGPHRVSSCSMPTANGGSSSSIRRTVWR
jgi:hypothetical protein